MKKLFALLLLLAIGAPSYAVEPSPSTGATAECSVSDVSSCSFGAYAATAGGFTLVGLRVFDGLGGLSAVVSSVTDGTNTYSSVCTSQVSATLRVYWYAAHNTSAGSVTVTANLSISTARVWGVLEHYTGALTASALEDIECGQGASASTHTSGTVTTTGVDRKIVCVIGAGTMSVTTIAPNSSEVERREVSAGAARLQLQDKSAATAGNYTCSWAFGASDTGLYMAAALKPAATGGGSASAATVVQISSKGQFPNGAAGATATATLTGVTANNSLLIGVAGFGNGTATPTVSCTDGTGFTQDVHQQVWGGTGGLYWFAAVHRRHLVTAGTHTVVCTQVAGTFASYGWIVVAEVSGLMNLAPDVTASNSGMSTSPTTGSATPTTAASLAIAVVSFQDGSNPATFGHPPPGYTSLGLSLDGSASVAGSADYKSFISTGAENPSYATWPPGGGGAYFVGVTAIYKATTGGGGGGGAPLLLRRRR